MNKIETIMDENHRRTSHLEKEIKDLEDKLTSVSLNLYAHYIEHYNYNYLRD